MSLGTHRRCTVSLSLTECFFSLLHLFPLSVSSLYFVSFHLLPLWVLSHGLFFYFVSFRVKSDAWVSQFLVKLTGSAGFLLGYFTSKPKGIIGMALWLVSGFSVWLNLASPGLTTLWNSNGSGLSQNNLAWLLPNPAQFEYMDCSFESSLVQAQPNSNHV